jgi:hypothetical protein
MASDGILDIKLSYTFMGGAREEVGAVGSLASWCGEYFPFLILATPKVKHTL